MISLILKQHAEDNKTTETGNVSTGSAWLSAGQKGACFDVFSEIFSTICWLGSLGEAGRSQLMGKRWVRYREEMLWSCYLFSA